MPIYATKARLKEGISPGGGLAMGGHQKISDSRRVKSTLKSY